MSEDLEALRKELAEVARTYESLSLRMSGPLAPPEEELRDKLRQFMESRGVRHTPKKWDAWSTVTVQEEVLAKGLRENGVLRYRQFEIKRPGKNSYWFDFAWPGIMFAVEIDGHPINLEREIFLRNLGWNILHIQNEHFETETDINTTVGLISNYVISLGVE